MVAEESEVENIREVHSCGRPPPEVTLIVVDPLLHRQCGDSEVGEVWLRSSSVAGGYMGVPEETEVTFRARVVEPSRRGAPLQCGHPCNVESADVLDGDDGGETFLRTGDRGFLFESQAR